MKTKIMTALTGLILLPLIANAQTIYMARWEIRFDFTVGNTTLPQGIYEVKPVSSDGGATLLQIKSLDGKHCALFITEATLSKTIPQDSVLRFRKYEENLYFLAEVFARGNPAGRKLTLCRMEREVSQKTNVAVNKAGVVPLAALVW